MELVVWKIENPGLSLVCKDDDVSTVFLGTIHGERNGTPVLWESLSWHDGEEIRELYTSHEDAVTGHNHGLGRAHGSVVGAVHHEHVQEEHHARLGDHRIGVIKHRPIHPVWREAGTEAVSTSIHSVLAHALGVHDTGGVPPGQTSLPEPSTVLQVNAKPGEDPLQLLM